MKHKLTKPLKGKIIQLSGAITVKSYNQLVELGAIIVHKTVKEAA